MWGRKKMGREISFLCTDTPIPDAVIAELRTLPSVKMAIPLEF